MKRSGIGLPIDLHFLCDVKIEIDFFFHLSNFQLMIGRIKEQVQKK